MEMEGRGFPDFYRNTSEELLLKSLMDTSIGMPIPTMEMLEFKNLSQNFRTDSEELFKSWLTNGEASSITDSANLGHGYSTSVAYQTRQASRRISTELNSISTQQHGNALQKIRSNDIILPQSTSTPDDLQGDPNQNSIRNAVEKGIQASNMYLAKAQLHSSQPMMRSRSSELRRNYAAMQSSQMPLRIDPMHNLSGVGVKQKQEFANPNGFCEVSPCKNPSQMQTFMSPSNSSSSTFNAPQVGNVDQVSSVVSMLKGTLEHKKLTNMNKKGTVEGSTFGFYGSQNVLANKNFDREQDHSVNETSGNYHEYPVQVNHPRVLQAVEGTVHIDLDNYVTTTNPIQMDTISQEPSQSESSAAAPVMSAGFDACDGPSNSGQAPSVCERSRNKVESGKTQENASRTRDIREWILESNLKEDRKKGSLVHLGSVTSAGSVDKGDPIKKRRVERSRKLAEAKERNMTPSIPSDMQSIMKRSVNLGKEVQSLKLNLSFMNRKDSEQTKQIEALQMQNKELIEEKEHLLEELERILETSKI
ncbi:hypothetical protein RJ641_035036 [Dillenia turbinata]|uniref:Protein CYCLOPS n=1 Tax=Dillenia turbinata TaxID=194707 RepID=A0AAN8VRS5_9MAGN